MRKLVIVLAAVFALSAMVYFYPDYAKRYSTLLRLNSNNKEKLPRNFRITESKTSGSSQFNESNLRALLKEIAHRNVIIVDLRGEPHGFINGDAVSWYTERSWLNEGKTEEEIALDQKRRLEALSNKYFAVLYTKEGHVPLIYWIKDIASSAEVVKRNGAGYVHFPVRDHQHPDPQIVDAFVAFIKNLEPDTWLHFHCSAGRGRTTTFLVMYDVLLNATSQSLDEIVAKHVSNGGVNIFEGSDVEAWKQPYALERAEFMKDFYNFAKENPDLTLTYSEWLNIPK